jgi:two-component system NtrC family sensor kinase
MSLRRKILVKDAVLLLALLFTIGGALWGLGRQQQHVRASLGEYAALQRVQSAGAHLVAYQQAVHAGHVRDPQALAELRAAVSAMGEYKAMVSQYNSVLPSEISPDVQSVVKAKTKSLMAGLVQLSMQVDPPGTRPVARNINPAAISTEIDALSHQLAELLQACDGFVQSTQLASGRDLRLTITAIASGAVCLMALALAASLWQYWQVIVPLHRLRAWCRSAAGGEFPVPYEPSSDREFQDLGRGVNKMAAELTAFHRRLEAMVAAKSRELVRSERLASVGYLAAGVAHEINSPLNIMSGYAELTLKRLGRLAPGAADADIAKYMSIIRSEAFRCKDITQKLLSLAKGNGDVREPISLAQIAAEVSTMVAGLKSFRGKRLDIAIDAGEPLDVCANPTEMKQVLLNLVINAIEAVVPESGWVKVSGRRSGEWIELEVSDNGRGMSRETLERVFEPFFTNKRGAGDPGTGLGLSITHAIVADHEGRIAANSDGPGLGSRFVVCLPAIRPAAASIAPPTVALRPAMTEAVL